MSISIPGDAQNAYNTVVKGDPKVEWAIFSLASAGSELKLQSTGSGLDDLQEEFMDGRIQYAFARVEDPNTSLERFIQINWCGDGVAAFQKGLFNTYSPQISGFLKATHIVLQARNEDDVTPDHIYKRMRESSGSKYGAGNAAASTPAASSFKAPPPTSAPKPYVPTSSSTSGFNKPTPGPSYNRPTGSFNKPTPSFTRPTASFNKPTPAPAAEETLAPPPREPTPPPAPVAAAPSPPAAAASKPAEDDRIAPVGTAYEPVKLAAPKKLTSRWGQGGFNNNADDEDKADEKPKVGGFNAARSAFTGGAAAAPSSTPSFGGASGASSGKKLTWSERQAETKRQREAEEKAATDAMSKVSISANDTGSKGFGYGGASSTPSAPPPAPPAADEEEDEDVPPPPPPPPAPLPPRVPEPEESKAEADEEWDDAPPAPPPPPMASRPVVPAPAAVEEDEEDDAPPPPPPPPPMPMPEEESAPAPVAAVPPMPSRAQAQPQKAASSGPKAKALYDYEATEDNEIRFNEDDVIEGIEQTDPDWWTGIDPKTGSKGLFPSNYVELMQGGDVEEDDVPPPPPAPPAAAAPSGKGKTAIAQYDYEATEDNEVSFAEGDEIVEIEETDPDWWTGTHAKSGQKGLFPANYVEVA